MNQGKLLASGTAEEVRRELGRTERALTAVVLEDGQPLQEWLNGRDGVSEIRVDGKRVVFGFAGDDQEQATLLSDMVGAKMGLKSLEEDGSSFEDILVKVAEGNREE
jgi:ABC-type uncharacterized transport system ATPase subunit